MSPALQEMLSTIPKHKGTEKMQADIKRRISRTRDDMLQAKKAAGVKHGISYTVKREGAGQVALVGPANAGKSAILAALSNAEPEVADYQLPPQWLMGSIRSAGEGEPLRPTAVGARPVGPPRFRAGGRRRRGVEGSGPSLTPCREGAL